MAVLWTLNPTRDGCRVEIVHELQFRWPALAWLAEPIIAGFFVRPIAARTLRAFKEHLEAPAQPKVEEDYADA
jgi:hypothetical protein